MLTFGRSVIGYLHDFFFKEISASGFGLMRVAWAFIVLLFLLGSHAEVVHYYSEAGIVPRSVYPYVFRDEYRFTILDVLSSPTQVTAVWWFFVCCLSLMMLGIAPRITTIISVLLLFSFQERNLQPLGGGDTVLRNVGFLLMICPEVSAFSLTRAREQWQHWKRKSTLLPQLKTHIWPYRLLLWQIMIIYIGSGWDKLQGTLWLDGTVVEAVFHHTHFFRYGKPVQDGLVWLSPFACFYTLIFEFLWLLLLVPKQMWYVLPERLKRHSLKRWLIIGGLLFHWGLFIFMDVGSFPFAMSVALIGLMLDEDFAALTACINRKWRGKVIILFDGICHLCRRSIFVLMLLDRLGRLQPVDFRDSAKRKKHAKDVAEKDLDRAMHIKLPSGQYFKGFYAFRKLCWHVPALKIITPLLYIPGIPPVGVMIYDKIAASRNKCAGGACMHKPGK